CRLPTRPFGVEGSVTAAAERDDDHVPLVLALTGRLELSHLHVANVLNMAVHWASKGTGTGKGGIIKSAIAYSVPDEDTETGVAEMRRLIIGEPLPLQFRIQWYRNTLTLPPGSDAADAAGAGALAL